MMRSLLLLSLSLSCLLFFSARAEIDLDDLKLNQHTFITSHNAATGEDNLSNGLARDVDNQEVPIAQQLECGARALDYRPFLRSDGRLVARHGIARIQVLMKQSVQSIKTWLQNNPTELVILYISKADAEGSFDSLDAYSFAEDVLLSEGVKWIRDCNEMVGLTLRQAKIDSQLANGGHLLAVFGCTDEQYDPNIRCYFGSHDCTDYGVLPFIQYDSYMVEHTNFPKASSVTNGRLYMSQAHWQYDAFALLVKSPAITWDERDSGLNARTAQAVSRGEYNFLNLLEVDNVCNNGARLKAAVEKFMAPNPQVNCLSNNNRLRVGEFIESENGQYKAMLRPDGQLCINGGSGVSQWCTGTSAPSYEGGAGIVKMKDTGNLQMFTPTDNNYWSTGTQGGGLELVLQNNRDLVIRNARTGVVEWSCSNNGGCPTVSCGSDCGSNACLDKSTVRSFTPAPSPAPPPNDGGGGGKPWYCFWVFC